METTANQTRYQARLDKVVEYIYEHLDEDIRIDELAEIACLSPYHWHRIYSAMRGETVAKTVKRLKLNRAAERLAHTDIDISTIASNAGYKTVESFNRAFKQVFEMPPASYRAKGSHAEYRTAIGSEDANKFEVVVRQLAPINCAAVLHLGSYMEIDRAMGKLFSALQQSGILPDAPRMMAQFIEDPDLVDESDLRSYACMPIESVAKLPDIIECRQLDPGLVATLRYQGPYIDMKPAYQWLYGVWLPQSGYEPANHPSIEEYLNNPQMVPPTKLLTDIHLPLRTQP